jgi:hypothetical protein
MLAGPNYVLTVGGKAAEQFFQNNLTITPNYATGMITSSGQLQIVTQIGSFAMTWQLNFSVGG